MFEVCVGNKKVLDFFKKQPWYPYFVENTLKQKWQPYSPQENLELEIKRAKLRLLFCCGMKGTVEEAFSWKETPQGGYFWTDIAIDMLRKISHCDSYNKYVYMAKRPCPLTFKH